MTAYQAGVRFEKRVSAYLRDEGYLVIESRGSHGLVDQMAVKAGQLLAIQSKVDGKISVDDWNQLFRLRVWTCAIPILARREGRRLALYELTGERVKWQRGWPMRPFVTDQVGAA